MNLQKAAFYLTCGSVVAVPVSIAVSQTLFYVALAILLISGTRLRFPPVKIPLAIFIGWTFLALFLSGDPRSGTPQIRKLTLFCMLLLVCSTFRSVAQIRGIVLAWGAVATVSSFVSFFQFWRKYQQAHALHKNFYDYYVSERITGFTSHWMTFGGEEMIILLMLLAFLFLSSERRWKAAGWACVAILILSLVLGMTRSIFLLGFPLGALYLVWLWKRWIVALAPVVLALGLLIGPLRERIVSVFQPHGQTDSNMHRAITRRTGLAMVKAHPWFGIGPEQIKPQFDRYLPADVQRPLPEGWYGHLHNIYLQYPAERGIPALLALLWMLGKMVRDFAMALRRKIVAGDARFVLHGAIAVMIAMLAEGFFEYNLGDSEPLMMFLAVMAFGYVAIASEEVSAV
ncbi:MAG TPA: O-antigen ligase family protein [Bryobacteraceae bacterium]|nr:O-antigen ligase family protein [Bryobacteraceae bacterium]